MMTRTVEDVARELAERLVRRGHASQRTLRGGMGSLRVVGNGRFAVQINDDRGILGITLGRQDAPEEDCHDVVSWSLCAGLVAAANPPFDWPPTAEASLAQAEEDADLTLRVLDHLDTLSRPDLMALEDCCRRRREEYWRFRGLPRTPRGGDVLRPPREDDEHPQQ